MIDVTLKHNGSYYLPYYSYPTKRAVKESISSYRRVSSEEKEADPKERFVNLFYREYTK